jgi:D-alanyl-D-alanine dipeptidase
VRVRDVHGRDASGMLARSAHAFSGEAMAAMAMRSVLGEVDEHGGIVGHQGQWWR